MSVVNSELRREKLKEIVPLAWDRYKHLYSGRRQNIDFSINLLIIVVTFLPLLSLALADLFQSDTEYFIFLFPILFEIIAFFVLLQKFFIKKGALVPWNPLRDDSEKGYKGDLDLVINGDFYRDFYSALKAAEEETGDYLREATKIINNALQLVFVSIYSLLLAVLFFIFNTPILLYITVVGSIVIIHFIQKRYRNQVESSFGKRYNSNWQKVGAWLEYKEKK